MNKTETEKLIREITEQVMEHIKKASINRRLPGEDGKGSFVSENSPGKGRRPGKLVILLPVYTAGIQKIAAAAESIKFGGWIVRAVASSDVYSELKRKKLEKSFSSVEEISSISPSDIINDLNPGDRLLLGSLGFGTASRLIALEDDDPFTRIIVLVKMAGLPVWILRDDLDSSSSPDCGISSRAKILLRDIGQLGLHLMHLSGLESELNDLRSARSPASRSAGGLLTEEEIERLHKSGEKRLVLSGKTIVTPLARSRAAVLGIELIEKGNE